MTIEWTTAQQPIDVVRAYCDAWLAGDRMAILGHYHPDITLLWAGKHRLAGTHCGLPAALDALMALQAVTNRVPIDVVDVLGSPAGAMAIVRERWTKGSADSLSDSIMLTRALSFTVVDEKLRTCQIFEFDQNAIDAWLSETDPSADFGPSEIADLLERCSSGWGSGDVEAILACHTQDTIFHHHGVADPAVGRVAVHAAFTNLLGTNEGLVTRKDRTTIGAAHAIVEYHVMVDVDGATMSSPAIDVFTFRDRLVATKDTWVNPLH